MLTQTKGVAVPVKPKRTQPDSKEATSQAVPFQVKADSIDEEARTFTGLASTWDLDLGGDVIHKGAFKRTLDHWRKSGRVLPLLDSHNAWSSVRAVIGKMAEAKETDTGLEATFSVIDGPDGDEVWRRIKGGFVDGLSIGYRPVKIEMPTEEEEREGVWRHLKEVELREVSVVLWPMNEGARIEADSLKSLLAAYEGRELDDEERAELAAIKAEIDGLLGEASQPDPQEEPEEEPEEPDEPKTLAPDDPDRIAVERRLRAMRLWDTARRIA